MYLIWRMDTTAKGAKKNTSPNVIHLQYPLLTRNELASLTSQCCSLIGGLSSCKQLGCFPLQMPQVCFLLQFLFVCPFRRHPKQRFLVRTKSRFSVIDKPANLSHLYKGWPSFSHHSHTLVLKSLTLPLC